MEVAVAGMAAAGSGLSSLATSSTALTVLQGGLSATSALMKMRSGGAEASAGIATAGQIRADAEAQASRAEAQAGMKFFAADQVMAEAGLSARSAEIESSLEYTAGKQRVAALQEDLGRTLSRNTVAYAASGVDAFSGTPARRAEHMQRQAERDMATEEGNAKIAALSSLLKASAITRQAAGQSFALETEGNQMLADAGVTRARGAGQAALAIRKGANAATSGRIQGLSQLAMTAADILKRK